MIKRRDISVPGLLISSLLSASMAGASELKDPFTRYDDLSGTTVEYEVTRTPQGYYEYTYHLSSPQYSTGEVLSFVIDLSCDEVPASKNFAPDDFSFHDAANATENEKYVPVAVRTPYGQAIRGALTVNRDVAWGVVMSPGETREGLALVSPYPPGNRVYQLRASGSYREDEYDYSIIREIMLDEEGDYPRLPWVDDWSVNGATVGPACPGEQRAILDEDYFVINVGQGGKGPR